MSARLKQALLRRRRGFTVAAGLLIPFAAVVLTTAGLVTACRRQVQMHTDARVATVWLAGITRGSRHTLTLGTPLQAWLSAHGITLFGSRRVLQSQYGGDPSGVELWFDYDSRLPGRPQLECHRVGETAFMDDLGQQYHGYLDFQGKTVGVYLPGYDHAAHQLYCALHWMPRQPGSRTPVSEPMVFRVALPPAPRRLPEAWNLPSETACAAKQGVSVTVSGVQLSAPKLGHYRTTQRDLTFRLRITGGDLDDDNIAPFESLEGQFTQNNVPGWRWPFRLNVHRITYAWPATVRSLPPSVGPSLVPLPPSHPVEAGSRRFTITDPYGISLLPQTERLMPLRTLDGRRPVCDSAGGGTVWLAPLNAAGMGTDVIRLHFDVRPRVPAGAPPNAPRPPSIPFDLLVPVQTGGEV